MVWNFEHLNFVIARPGATLLKHSEIIEVF